MFPHVSEIVANQVLQRHRRVIPDLQHGRGEILRRKMIDNMQQHSVVMMPEREQALKFHAVVMRPTDAGVLVITRKDERPLRLIAQKALMIVARGIHQMPDNLLDRPAPVALAFVRVWAGGKHLIHPLDLIVIFLKHRGSFVL